MGPSPKSHTERDILLGYEGFLNRWAVSFDRYHAFFVVEPIESFEERIPIDPWEEFQRLWPDSYDPRPD